MNTTLICITRRQDEKKIPFKLFLRQPSFPQRYIHINSYTNDLRFYDVARAMWQGVGLVRVVRPDTRDEWKRKFALFFEDFCVLFFHYNSGWLCGRY